MTTLNPGGMHATHAERVAQIRQRYERKHAAHDMLAKPDPARHTGHPGDGAVQRLQSYAVTAAMSADDVPWLLDELEHGRAVHAADLQRWRHDNDGMLREIADWKVEYARLKTANDRLLPVVEAVGKWVEVRQNPRMVATDHDDRALMIAYAAMPAVDALGTDAADGAGAGERPTIVCLCGSTRFSHAFREANLRETLAGRIVLSIGCDMRSDADLFADLDEAAITRIKSDLDELHKRKIDLADEVLVLNLGGYIGDSTRSEVEYAHRHGKAIRYLEPAASPGSSAADEGKLPDQCDDCETNGRNCIAHRQPAWKAGSADEGDGRVCRCAELDIEPPNDIEATGRCCCNGCIGEGMCDLAEPEERDDEEDAEDERP